MTTLTLPTEIKKPSDNIWDYTFFFAGDKKVGKTSFLAQFPDHFILEGEPKNADHIEGNYVDIHNWKEFLSYISLLEKTPNYCKILCIEDIPSIYRLLHLQTRKELKLSKF